MNLYYVLPLIIGVSAVLQTSLNREMALTYGLSSAVLLNAAVFMILSLCLFAMGKYTPSLVPEFLQAKPSDVPIALKYFIPGICGFLFVLFLPWAMQNIGPANTFLFLVGAQIVVSVLLEAMRTQSFPGIYKLLGAGLVVVGGIMATKG